ncbi:MAG TPA: peptidyl-prolyl cis-trans isomerase [Caulobacteraceae bacterium]|nr:peptidyl-prolyl cis-trans isomerase [Caulobacteraceae bacterium]
MLAFFRTLSQSRIMWALLGIPLVGGLLVIGNTRANLSGLFVQDSVIAAGARTYSQAEYKREFEAYRQRLAQQGQAVTVDDMVSQGADQQVLQSLARRESLAEQLRRDGVIPSDNLIVAQIKKIAAFFDPISGKFDQKTYTQRLADNQLTPETFQNELRDEAASDHFAAGMAAGLKPPRLLDAVITDFQSEAHTFDYLLVDPKLLGAPPTPTDAQLTTLMNANAQALTTPETRVFSVVRFSAKALAPTMTADPAEVQKRYDFRKDTLSTPEKRTVVQIPAKTADEAAGIAAKLASGADPAAVAKAAGEQVVNYTDQPKAGIADPKVADAAFALPEGKSSGPIQGQLGLAVVKVLKVTPGHQVSLDEARPKIEEEVKAEAAVNQAYALSQKYETAHDKGASFADAAKAAGVAPTSIGPVTAQGQDAQGKPLGLSPKMLAEGFKLTQNGDSDVVQEDKGEYFVLHADKVIPPQPPTLDKVRPQLTQYFQVQELRKRMSAKLDELIARIKKGESLESVAASVGGKVAQASLTRQQAQGNRQMSQEVLAQIFQSKVGDVFPAGAAIVKITGVVAPNAQVTGQSVQPVEQDLSRGIFQELIDEAGSYAQTKLKTKVNTQLARQAIGASPDAGAPLAPAKPAPATPAQ